MNRIDKCFEDLKNQGKKALITFVTAGDPDLETTERLVLEMFDKYYRYTTVTNESGDYMIFGVPVGEQVLHVELDLSDIGI